MDPIVKVVGDHFLKQIAFFVDVSFCLTVGLGCLCLTLLEKFVFFSISLGDMGGSH